MDKKMISVDNLTYGVILSALHHAFAYPINDTKIKAGFEPSEFKGVFESYDIHVNEINSSDINIISSAINLMLTELNDNDFNNLIQVSKASALKIKTLLEAAGKDENIISITSDLWEAESISREGSE